MGLERLSELTQRDGQQTFRCDDDFLLEELLEALAEVAEVGPEQLSDEQDSYFDTRTRSLASAGLAARCRRKGRQREIDLQPVPINPALIIGDPRLGAPLGARQSASSALLDLLASEVGLELRGQLGEELVVRRKRRSFELVKEGAEALLVVDEVDVRKPRQRKGIPIEEVTLLPLSGSPEGLEAIAEALRGHPPLLPAEGTGFLRARELVGLPAHAYGAPGPSFGPFDSIDEVGRAICRAQLATVRSYEPGTLVGLDTEHLHKMRVATRRLRAALNAFSSCFDARNGDFLSRNFKWLAAVLGDVRDLDVHQLDVPRWRRELGEVEGDGWQSLERALAARWEITRESLLKAMTTRRYQRLLERAEEAFANVPERRPGHPGLEPVGLLAARAFCKRARQFRKAIRACQRTDDPEAVHQLRIIGKKLRYTGEFFRPLFSGRFTKGIKRLSAFQDELGLFQDSCVAGELAQRLRDEALARGDSASYLHVLGLLAGSSIVGAQFGQLKAELALETLGGEALLASLTKEAERLAKSVTKVQTKADKG